MPDKTIKPIECVTWVFFLLYLLEWPDVTTSYGMIFSAGFYIWNFIFPMVYHAVTLTSLHVPTVCGLGISSAVIL